jgi:5'-nucleotidase
MSLLKIGISSRALFDLVESHEIFKKSGIEEYSNYQKKNENKTLEK